MLASVVDICWPFRFPQDDESQAFRFSFQYAEETHPLGNLYQKSKGHNHKSPKCQENFSFLNQQRILMYFNPNYKTTKSLREKINCCSCLWVALSFSSSPCLDNLQSVPLFCFLWHVNEHTMGQPCEMSQLQPVDQENPDVLPQPKPFKWIKTKIHTGHAWSDLATQNSCSATAQRAEDWKPPVSHSQGQ